MLFELISTYGLRCVFVVMSIFGTVIVCTLTQGFECFCICPSAF